MKNKKRKINIKTHATNKDIFKDKIITKCRFCGADTIGDLLCEHCKETFGEYMNEYLW